MHASFHCAGGFIHQTPFIQTGVRNMCSLKCTHCTFEIDSLDTVHATKNHTVFTTSWGYEFTRCVIQS